MRKTLYFFLLVSPFFFFTSCEDEEEQESSHGCLDSNATNYNSNAIIDNNSCCYMCSDVSTGVLIGEFCGSEAENAELNGITIEEIAQLYLINGTLVPPNTPGALPAFDSQGNPIYGNIVYQNVICN